MGLFSVELFASVSLSHDGVVLPFIWELATRLTQLELPAFSKGQLLKTSDVPQKLPSLPQNHQKLSQLFLKVHPVISPDPIQIQSWMSNHTSRERTGLSEQRGTMEILLGRLKRKRIQPSAFVSLTHLLFTVRRLNYSSL